MTNMNERWWSRHGTTLIALGAALALGLVALLLWFPPWSKASSHTTGRPSGDGWQIRYNATLALARRGSEATRLDILEEMLDGPTQLANFSNKLANGKEAANEEAAFQTLESALEATQILHEKSVANITKTGWWQLSDHSMTALKSEPLPETVLAKLVPLKNREFETQPELVAELAKVLDRSERDQWEKIILSRADRTLNPDIAKLLRPAVEILTEHPNRTLRDKAKAVLEELGKDS
jgi:hypothetical protein